MGGSKNFMDNHSIMSEYGDIVTNPASGRFIRNKKSIVSVKCGPFAPKMAQIEVCMYTYVNFQVLKMSHYIINSLKIWPEVTKKQ